MKRGEKKETVLQVKEEQALIDFLLAKMGGMRRTSVKQLLSHRQVEVNGKIETRFDLIVNPGDKVSICKAKANVELSHPKLRIVYEDEYLIVVEKKEGLLTVATYPGSTEMTCMSILKQYVRNVNPRAGIYVVHRLDRETSGLLVFAKSSELQEYMRTYWREIVKKRTYIALAEGIFEEKEGKITTWLREDKKNAHVYSSPVDDGGQIAITNYKVVRQTEWENNNLSLVELNLETGRTNQIRVHLQGLHHPIVGDRKYGSGSTPIIDRLALHAKVLEFIHPATEETIHFETPIPKDFLRVMQRKE